VKSANPYAAGGDNIAAAFAEAEKIVVGALRASLADGGAVQVESS
jgi:hypothetical protein